MSEKIDYGMPSYILGIISIVLGIFSPLAGIVLGIITLNISKKQSDTLSKKGRKFGVIGIIIGITMLIIAVLFSIWINKFCEANPSSPLCQYA